MPGMYAKGDFDLAGFAVGAVERDAMLPRPDIAPGDAIIGIRSNGVHSNGYSLVRRLVADNALAWDTAAPFAPEKSLGEALLTPTRIYVAPLLGAMQERPGAIKALAHITGGGLTENLPRVLPSGISAQIDLRKIAPPAVFGWLAGLGRIDERELLRTFNCGVGMTVIADADLADAVLADLTKAGEDAAIIGTCTDGDRSVDYAGRLDLKGAAQ